jgi:hypothetical protein
MSRKSKRPPAVDHRKARANVHHDAGRASIPFRKDGVNRPTLRDFGAQSTPAAFTAYAIRQSELPRLALSADAGNVENARIVEQIIGWCERIDGGWLPLCCNCDHQFVKGSSAPGAYVTLVPFASGIAVTDAVCVKCAAKFDHDLIGLAMKRWRQMWPGIETVDGGRA